MRARRGCARCRRRGRSRRRPGARDTAHDRDCIRRRADGGDPEQDLRADQERPTGLPGWLCAKRRAFPNGGRGSPGGGCVNLRARGNLAFWQFGSAHARTDQAPRGDRKAPDAVGEEDEDVEPSGRRVQVPRAGRLVRSPSRGRVTGTPCSSRGPSPHTSSQRSTTSRAMPPVTAAAQPRTAT